MRPRDLLAPPRPPVRRPGPAGAVVGIVTDNTDPLGWGRVKVRFPWLADQATSDWCRIAQPYAGQGRGSFWLPEVGDEVAVVFEGGDMNAGYVLGGLWNAEDIVPPPGNADGANDHKIWRTRQGHQIAFQDTAAGEKITITDGPRQRHLVIDVAADTITLTADPGDITFEAPSKSVTVSCKTLDIDVTANSTWQIGTTLSESCTDRSETISGADTISVAQLWSIETKDARIEPSSSTATFNRLAADVTADLVVSGADRQLTATDVSRVAAAETSTYGTLNVTSASRVAFACDGPIALDGATTLIDTLDAVFTGAALTVDGGMITVTGSTGVSALASTIKLN